jgi:hypothetical protein
MQTGFLLMKNKSSGNKEYEGAYNKETLNICENNVFGTKVEYFYAINRDKKPNSQY